MHTDTLDCLPNFAYKETLFYNTLADVRHVILYTVQPKKVKGSGKEF